MAHAHSKSNEIRCMRHRKVILTGRASTRDGERHKERMRMRMRCGGRAKRKWKRGTKILINSGL